MQITDWDDAYANGAYIEGADRIVAGWKTRAAAFREGHEAQVLRTGSGARQFVDLYRPEGASTGLTVIVHGGYWMAFDGRDFAHLAAGPLARGQVVAMVTYTLSPAASIAAITAEVAQAICAAAAQVDGPIRLTGHSAGGHLVTRALCKGVLPVDIARRIVHTVSISGVHDLRPLLKTKMNDTFGLTELEAAAESPALLTPIASARVACVVGAKERPEFLRQTALLAMVWHGLGAQTGELQLPGEDHFTIIAGLERADGPLTDILLS